MRIHDFFLLLHLRMNFFMNCSNCERIQTSFLSLGERVEVDAQSFSQSFRNVTRERTFFARFPVGCIKLSQHSHPQWIYSEVKEKNQLSSLIVGQRLASEASCASSRWWKCKQNFNLIWLVTIHPLSPFASPSSGEVKEFPNFAKFDFIALWCELFCIICCSRSRFQCINSLSSLGCRMWLKSMCARESRIRNQSIRMIPLHDIVIKISHPSSYSYAVISDTNHLSTTTKLLGWYVLLVFAHPLCHLHC